MKIVVLTGAGISAESGLPTFRGAGGLWNGVRAETLATPEAFADNPQRVLDFYNFRRAMVREAAPNAAHQAIAALERHHPVSVVTQNVDNLHERAGSTDVLHVHGEIILARSSRNPGLKVPMQDQDIRLGDLADDGAQLRPDVVWFGEAVRHIDESLDRIREADRFLVVGTSLQVWPVADWVHHATRAGERVIIAPELRTCPDHFEWICGTACDEVPPIMSRWARSALAD